MREHVQSDHQPGRMGKNVYEQFWEGLVPQLSTAHEFQERAFATLVALLDRSGCTGRDMAGMDDVEKA